MLRVSQPILVTTDASGNATAYSEGIGGKIHSIIYVKDGTTPFAAGVDFTITDADNGQTLWTQVNQDASAVKYPRLIAQAGAGTDLTGWYVEPICTGTVKIQIAQGGASKTGTFRVVYER